MDIPLNVLILEDRPADAELMVEELRKAGFEPQWRRVETEHDYLEALDPSLDVILADHSLPQYDSVRALERLQERGLEVPFVIVSGSIEPELAVQMMKNGAADYVWKDRMERLGQTVIKAVEQKRLRCERNQAEKQALLQSAALEAAANGIVITDRQGAIFWVNEAFTRLTGYTLAEARGKNPRILKSGKHPRSFYKNMWSTILAGNVWHGELVNRRKDGRLYAEEMTITPVYAKGDEPSHFIAIKQDITERKQAETLLCASEAKLSAISAAAFDAIVMTDGDGEIVFWNPAAERTLGYMAAEITGKNLHRLLTPRYIPDFDKGLAAFKQTGQGPMVGKIVETSAVHRDGHEFPVEVSLGAIRMNDQWCAVGIVRDISARSQAEDKIRTLNAELEQKVRDRTVQLESANKELEAFAYSVSHDLRAPLRGIDGFSQALLEDYHDKLDAGGRDFLRRVREASQRMGRLIDDILQLSRLTRSSMIREQVDLSAMAMVVVAELQAADRARRVEFCLTPGLKANSDARLLEVALINLLGNAWKFTSKTENARIEFGKIDQNGQTVFFVRDNGAGFDMAYANRLFGAFQRLHSNEEFPGTGIGLATVQRIIHRHGGRIWAEAAVGKGATFFFTLESHGKTP